MLVKLQRPPPGNADLLAGRIGMVDHHDRPAPPAASIAAIIPAAPAPRMTTSTASVAVATAAFSLFLACFGRQKRKSSRLQCALPLAKRRGLAMMRHRQQRTSVSYAAQEIEGRTTTIIDPRSCHPPILWNHRAA